LVAEAFSGIVFVYFAIYSLNSHSLGVLVKSFALGAFVRNILYAKVHSTMPPLDRIKRISKIDLTNALEKYANSIPADTALIIERTIIKLVWRRREVR
jgi:hypothetical protein